MRCPDYLREGLDNFSSQNQTPRSSFQGEGDRFLSQHPLPKNKTMLLEISIPVYRRDRWDRLERDGKIQVSSEVDTLSEGYNSLKKELDALLTQVDAQTRLAQTALELENEIDKKKYTLRRLAQDIERASEHYKNLKILLENFGIDHTKKQLTFDSHLLLSSGSVSEVAAESGPVDHEF
jgi:hypothetical protein